MVGERLAGESLTKTATLLGVWRATVSEVMSLYVDISEEEHRAV
jgi:hypothetical protein